jgi:hypothetical protein
VWSEYPNYVFHGITAAWNKLCRTDVLKKNHIIFADARCAEDQIFAINIRISSSKIVYINEAFYHYLIDLYNFEINKTMNVLNKKMISTNSLISKLEQRIASLESGFDLFTKRMNEESNSRLELAKSSQINYSTNSFLILLSSS